MGQKTKDEKSPILNMATKYGVAYVIIYETKPKWRQEEIERTVGQDTRMNSEFAKEVIEFAEAPENLTILEDKLDEINAVTKAARKLLPELKFDGATHTKSKKK